MNRKEFLEELREQEARDNRQIATVAGCGSLLLLVLVAIVFVGCPGAVSYGISRGCAAGTEHAR